MKKKIAVFLTVFLSLSMISCSSQGKNDTDSYSSESSETTETLEVEADPLHSIVYNGVNYYGLVFYANKDFKPENTVLIGTTDSNSAYGDISLNETTNIPTKELETNWTDADVEIYAVFVDDTVTEFYGTLTQHNSTEYVALKNLTIEKPTYYN